MLHTRREVEIDWRKPRGCCFRGSGCAWHLRADHDRRCSAARSGYGCDAGVRAGGRRYVVLQNAAHTGRNFVLAGSESRVGESGGRARRAAWLSGTRDGCASGARALMVTRRPRVAILATGDELVSIEQAPGSFQIRNSNSISLAAQVAMAGGEPVMLGSAPDELGKLRALIGRGVEADILVLTGGVSVGKYDLVEQVSARIRRGIFLRCDRDSPGQAGCLRLVPREAHVWSAGESGFHDGDVRAARGARD